MSVLWHREVFPIPEVAWCKAGDINQLSSQSLGFDVINEDGQQEIYRMVSRVLDAEQSFALFDLGFVVHQYHLWKKNFPMIQPFYAVKAYDDPAVLNLLAFLGVGFDCSNKIEMDLCLNAGVVPSNIILANTIKFRSDITFAVNQGVQLMTFDNEHELMKIKENAPNARLMLRIAPQHHAGIQYKLNKKFGCSLIKVRTLLYLAKDLGLNVKGVSFHVGSGVSDAEVFIVSIEAARYVFDVAKKEGMQLTLLDIGGGFYGDSTAGGKLNKMAGPIKETLSRLFPSENGVKVISEPGRYFVEGALPLAMCVIGKRRTEQETIVTSPDMNGYTKEAEEQRFEYYVSESSFGSLSLHLYFTDLQYEFVPISKNQLGTEKYKSKLWGPTCDTCDYIQEVCYLPELSLGDWLVVHEVGCYNVSLAGTFNGIQPCPIRRVMQRQVFEQLLKKH